MIIVSGWLRVRPEDRGHYLDSCLQVMHLARSTDGCFDFHLAADPLEEDRINVFERWADREALDAFRSAGPSQEQVAAIVEAEVVEYLVADATGA